MDAAALDAAEDAALDAELAAADAELAPYAAGAPFRALAPVVVRAGAAMDSPKAGGKVAEGQEVLVLERKVLKDGTVRLRFSGGWVSEKAKGGKTLLQSVGGPGSQQDRLLAFGFTAPPHTSAAGTAAGTPKKELKEKKAGIAAENAQMQQELAAIAKEIKHTDGQIAAQRAAAKG